MASQPTPQPQGAPQGGAGAAPGASAGAQPGGGGVNPMQIIAAMTRLAQMLAQAAPPTAPDAEQIIKSVQEAARKLMPQQPDQRQQSPF